LDVDARRLMTRMTSNIPMGDKGEVIGLDAREASMKRRKKKYMKLKFNQVKLTFGDGIKLHEVT
jgi:ubiquinone/menaquinone biosynthesis C-methylase UbiE